MAAWQHGLPLEKPKTCQGQQGEESTREMAHVTRITHVTGNQILIAHVKALWARWSPWNQRV